VRLLFHSVVMCLLIVSVVRSGLTIKKGLKQQRASRAEADWIPPDSDLIGIDADGMTRRPDLGPDGHLKGGGSLFMFVIHRRDILAEVQFWNHVIASDTDSAAGNRPIQYWGVCDESHECNSYQSKARFSIISHLSPYQMHIVANADRTNDALLYDKALWLRALVSIERDPFLVSEEVRRKKGL